MFEEWQVSVVLYESGLVKIRHQLQHARYHGWVDIFVEFELNGLAHVPLLSNILVSTIIQLIRDEFDEHFDENGLRRDTFVIETLTATVVDYEMWDYGEREHDDDDEDIGDDDDVNDEADNNDDDDNIDIIRRWVGHDNMDIIRRWVGQDYDEDEEESEEESEEEEEEEEDDDDNDDDDDDDDEDEVNYRPDPQSRD